MAICYPEDTDWLGCGITEAELNTMDDEVKARSEMLAWLMLARLMGGRLALCATTIRPCLSRCWGDWAPYMLDGRWYNACGHPRSYECGCEVIHQIKLPGEVSGPVTVEIDGVTLDPDAYRIDNGNLLVRQDGEPWPVNQNAALPLGEVGTMGVTYFQGVGPTEDLQFAAGLLAVEWYKNCQGKDCALPASVTSVTRQGIAFTLPNNMDTSGIRAVDDIVAGYNPYRLKTPSRVLSPDMIRHRQRTA